MNDLEWLDVLRQSLGTGQRSIRRSKSGIPARMIDDLNYE